MVQAAQKVNKITRGAHKLLHNKEIFWTKDQKELQKQRVLTKMSKAKKLDFSGFSVKSHCVFSIYKVTKAFSREKRVKF